MNYLLLSPKKMDDEPLLKDGSGVVSMSLIGSIKTYNFLRRILWENSIAI